MSHSLANKLIAKRMFYVVLFSVLLMINSSCKETNGDDVKPAKQSSNPQFVFAITYDNWAWGQQHDSLSLRSDGQLVASVNNRTSDIVIEDAQNYTHAILSMRFDFEATLVTQLDTAQLSKYYQALQDVDRKLMSKPISKGADIGSMKIWGFIYQADSATYQSVLLADKGDWQSANQSAQAQGIISWMQQLAKDSAVAPFTNMLD